MDFFKWHRHYCILKTVFKKIPSYPVFYSLCHAKQQMKKRWKTSSGVWFSYKFIHLKTQSHLPSFPMCLFLFLLHLYLISLWGGTQCYFLLLWQFLREASLIICARHGMKFLSNSLQIESGFWQLYVFSKREIYKQFGCLEHSFHTGEGNGEAQCGIMRIPAAFWAGSLYIVFCTQSINLPLHELQQIYRKNSKSYYITTNILDTAANKTENTATWSITKLSLINTHYTQVIKILF